MEKLYLKPDVRQVQTQWGPVRVKVAEGFGVTRAKPEFEDVAALAQANGLPYGAVYADVLRKMED